MSDISRNAADLPVVIIGATTAGVPTTPVASDSNGGLIIAGEGSVGSIVGGVLTIQGGGPSGIQAPTRDIINTAAQYQAISVSTTSVEAKGAATRLINRKFLSITPTNGTIYWASNSSVTVTTGSPLFSNNTLFLSFSDNVTIFLIAASAIDVRILEGS